MKLDKDHFVEERNIGNVRFFASEKSKKEARYSDGDIEDTMLRFFAKKPTTEDIDHRLAEKDLSWPELYHYTPVRENLLQWYSFDPDKTLLEIGPGAGALTGLFARSVKDVTAVELTYRRAEITATRHQSCKNLTVIASDIKDLPDDEKFDYVTSIGVLEYAGVLSDAADPFLDFLKLLHSRLAAGGTAIIAIENKFGLKYWAGSREDHTNHLFDSLEGYPDQKEKQTFGREALAQRIANAGFAESDFHYPLPDYKLPTEIFSDDYLPSSGHYPRTSHYPFRDYSGLEQEVLFDQRRVMEEVIREGQFPFFANSFLVFAHKA